MIVLSKNRYYDVIIIGAGPVGLLLAADCARNNLTTLLIEKNEKKHAHPTVHSKAFILHPRTLEILYARRLYENLDRQGVRLDFNNKHSPMSFDVSRFFETRFNYSLAIPQTLVEQELYRFMIASNSDYVNDNVVEVKQTDTECQVFTESTIYTASHVIACTGVSVNPAQKMFPVSVSIPYQSFYFTTIDIIVKTSKPIDYPQAHTFNASFMFAAPYQDWEDGQQKLHIYFHNPSPQVQWEQIVTKFYEITAILHVSVFKTRNHLVSNYRYGRVLVAGDAAHTHNPLGGLGLNTGLQDANNLAWKLAHSIYTGDSRILDSYRLERQPYAFNSIKATTRLFNNLQSLCGSLIFKNLKILPYIPLLNHSLIGHVTGLGKIGGVRASFWINDHQHIQDLCNGVDFLESKVKGRHVLMIRPDGIQKNCSQTLYFTPKK